MSVVAFLGRDDVEDVILNSRRRLTAPGDAREAALLKKPPRGEVVPDWYFLGSKHGLELRHPVACDAKDDGDALHIAVSVAKPVSSSWVTTTRRIMKCSNPAGWMLSINARGPGRATSSHPMDVAGGV